MKRAISLVLLSVFGMALIGCEASVGHPDADNGNSGTSYKKTTTVDSNGDKTVHTTETKKDSSY